MFSKVSIVLGLTELALKYGSDRLNVVNIKLEECLECSPYQGMDLSKRPAMAKYVVQLVLLWQFGGTILDPSVVAVHGEIYRASDTAVVYSNYTISSPEACHAFIYDMMLCAKNYALKNWIFKPKTAQIIVKKTVEYTERIPGRHNEARPVANGVVCRDGGMIGGHCYYVEADRMAAYDVNSYVMNNFCPIIRQSSFPWSKTPFV